MQHKLRKTPDQVVAIAREMVAYARSLGCTDVEFSPEDAGRYSVVAKSLVILAIFVEILAAFYESEKPVSTIPLFFGYRVREV